MKAYKGFNKDMTCLGFQYEEGKSYETDRASLCNEGFHACEAPLDCFHYYLPADSVYHEVELEELTEETSADSKRVGKRIRVGAKLDVAGLVKAQFEYVKEHTTEEHTDSKAATAGARGAATAGYCGAATAGDRGAATAGDCGAATAGARGAATAGYCGAATAGDSGAATAGYCGAATAGYCGAATAGYCGAATAGDSGAATAGARGAATAGARGAATAGYCGAATAGYCGAATAGYCGAATSRGSSKTGENGLSVARGIHVRAMGGLGAVLVLCEEEANTYDIKEWKAAVVDGETIKPDTWYELRDGEFKEVTDDEE